EAVAQLAGHGDRQRIRGGEDGQERRQRVGQFRRLFPEGERQGQGAARLAGQELGGLEVGPADVEAEDAGWHGATVGQVDRAKAPHGGASGAPSSHSNPVNRTVISQPLLNRIEWVNTGPGPLASLGSSRAISSYIQTAC